MQSLKQSLESMDPAFASKLATKTREAEDFGQVLQLCTLRKRALARGLLNRPERTRRVAIMGGANLRPMVDLIEHFAAVPVIGSIPWIDTINREALLNVFRSSFDRNYF